MHWNTCRCNKSHPTKTRWTTYCYYLSTRTKNMKMIESLRTYVLHIYTARGKIVSGLKFFYMNLGQFVQWKVFLRSVVFLGIVPICILPPSTHPRHRSALHNITVRNSKAQESGAMVKPVCVLLGSRLIWHQASHGEIACHCRVSVFKVRHTYALQGS